MKRSTLRRVMDKRLPLDTDDRCDILDSEKRLKAKHRAALLRFGERVKEALARMLEDDGRVKPASEVRAFDVAALFLKVAP